jgi:hypothetical protein
MTITFNASLIPTKTTQKMERERFDEDLTKNATTKNSTRN